MASSSDPARLTPAAAEKARLCILAARLRTRRMKFTDIATELGLSSPQAAKQAVSAGLGLMPAENFAETRREITEELDELSRETWKRLDNPAPMTTVSGKLVINPDTGQPYTDRQAEIATIRTLLEINKARRQVHGVDAPKQSVQFSGTLEDLRAEVERKQRELEAAEQGDGGGTVAALPQRGG
jgi:predicted transcriptional regulator